MRHPLTAGARLGSGQGHPALDVFRTRPGVAYQGFVYSQHDLLRVADPYNENPLKRHVHRIAVVRRGEGFAATDGQIAVGFFGSVIHAEHITLEYIPVLHRIFEGDGDRGTLVALERLRAWAGSYEEQWYAHGQGRRVSIRPGVVLGEVINMNDLARVLDLVQSVTAYVRADGGRLRLEGPGWVAVINGLSVYDASVYPVYAG